MNKIFFLATFLAIPALAEYHYPGQAEVEFLQKGNVFVVKNDHDLATILRSMRSLKDNDHPQVVRVLRALLTKRVLRPGSLLDLDFDPAGTAQVAAKAAELLGYIPTQKELSQGLRLTKAEIAAKADLCREIEGDLIAATRHPDLRVAGAALIALGRIYSRTGTKISDVKGLPDYYPEYSSIWGTLSAWSEDPEPQRRIIAIEAISLLGDLAHEGLLREMAKNGPKAVTEAAREALKLWGLKP